MTDASNMPARIWADLNSPAWSGSLDQVNGFDSAMPYYRADLVEPLVEALDGLVQRFDTFDGQPFVNPADSPWSIARAALTSYREADHA